MTSLMTPFLTARALAQRLDGGDADYDSLVDMASDKQFVLLGEATHGTQEFYQMRADITRRLIEKLGFEAVAIEGDWPDVWRANHFASGGGTDDARSALDDFTRFPSWMWRNLPVLDFISWLRAYNEEAHPDIPVGIYGLDLYSLYRSADAVIAYLDQVDPDQAEMARDRYAALDHVREPQVYGYQAASGLRPAAQKAVVAQLFELRNHEQTYLKTHHLTEIDRHFFAERNAAVVVSAENYYRAMFQGRLSTWNLRDSHMHDTLCALSQHRERLGGSGKIIVWAHNSHLGNARATEAHLRGEWNLGQLMREAAGEQVLLVGFTTYAGQVTAASRWDGETERKQIRSALNASYEHLFHSTGLDRFFIRLDVPEAERLKETMLERAIGVIYLPESERASHYFVASLAQQFDAVFHLDETSALESLEAPHARYQTERLSAIS